MPRDMVDARAYHRRTNHSPASVRGDGFRLDFENKPRPAKRYEDLPRVSLPTRAEPPSTPALAAVATAGPAPSTASPEGSLDAATLGTLCRYAAGVTKTLEVGGEPTPFRAAACTGKLYHVDVYPVVADLDGLDAGVYHFDPPSGDLDGLRRGDHRGVLADAAGAGSGVGDAPATLVLTSEWWRNAWKYRTRTYRHAFWDAGTILANLLATAHADGRRAAVVPGFADDPVVDLLGLDPDEEAPVALVPLGTGEPAGGAEPVEPIAPATAPLSDHVVDYPLVPDAWRQSRLGDGRAATDWRERVAAATTGDLGVRPPGDGERVDLDPVDAETASSRPVGATVERRGSLRAYARDPVSDRLFATVLDRALGGLPLACRGGDDAPVPLEVHCLVHAVEGVPAGAYRYHPGEAALERVGETDRRTAGHLALDQGVVGEAAANVYLLADVEAVVERFGNRGYRLAQLAGGLALGRLYLATYAHRAIGGRGFTFYDDQVAEHLDLASTGLRPMTLFAFGRPPD